MFNGKLKAITFSYDDGVTQDKRLIDIFNKYGLKCTFNINSGLLGTAGLLVRDGVTVAHCKPRPEEIKRIYEGHEIASHSLTHPMLPELSDEEIISEVENDRIALSELAGYEVVGFAYPGGGVNFDRRVAEIIKNNTGVKYCRTTVSTHNFEIQSNLFEFRPTVGHHREYSDMLKLGKKFIELETDKPALLYIWGHSYEFDIYNRWNEFEEFCKFISNRDDIFYGTNKDVLLNEL